MSRRSLSKESDPRQVQAWIFERSAYPDYSAFIVVTSKRRRDCYDAVVDYHDIGSANELDDDGGLEEVMTQVKSYFVDVISQGQKANARTGHYSWSSGPSREMTTEEKAQEGVKGSISISEFLTPTIEFTVRPPELHTLGRGRADCIEQTPEEDGSWLEKATEIFSNSYQVPDDWREIVKFIQTEDAIALDQTSFEPREDEGEASAACPGQ